MLGVERIESPNCDDRPVGTSIELIVVHSISLPPGHYGGVAIVDLFTNRLDPRAHPYFEALRDLKVSAHFLVRRGGGLVQFVSCRQRAWHAGPSSWRGRMACNDYSIGIEFEGVDDAPFAAVQYRVGKALITAIRTAYPIGGVAAHSEIAPGRKTDPGPHFDWSALELPPAFRTL
jgi:AmpD protein